ncbi:hypothetical protein SAM19_00779 [Brevibacillus laterosporus]|nr:hypothetical protein [Brevibacillus laterosporus]
MVTHSFRNISCETLLAFVLHKSSNEIGQGILPDLNSELLPFSLLFITFYFNKNLDIVRIYRALLRFHESIEYQNNPCYNIEVKVS